LYRYTGGERPLDAAAFAAFAALEEARAEAGLSTS
jgi:hypothetical protein